MGPSWAGPRGRRERRCTALRQIDRRRATCLVCCSRSTARSPSSAVLVSATNSRKRGCGLPPCTQLGRGTCDPSYMSHPSFPRRTARAWPAGRLGRRRFVVPRRLWLPTSCSRQGRARRHSRKFPSPTNHRPATGHISRACREAATTRSTPQVASAPRARTSPAIMVVHVQRRLWPPLSGVGCDNSPTGVRDGGYDPPWVRRHAHPPQQAPGGSGRRRSRHRFIGHGKQPGGRRHGGPSGGCSRPTPRGTSEMTSRCPIRPRETPTRQLGGALL